MLNHGESEVEKSISREATRYVLLRDIEYSHYVRYLRKWQEVVGGDQLHVFTFESMKKDTRSFMQKLATSLGLDPDFYEDFEFSRKNETYQVRNSGLHRVSRSLGGMLPRKSPLREMVRKLYRSMQTKKAEGRSEADQAAIEQLKEVFVKSNLQLAEEFNLNLDDWN